ncbi:hypothetical protein [Opitutus terrae]|uniref:Uncharacterized protein n=1 Tax=Opitutus terrae (strain DSM 11246 / JCM 15787 / PB90-1) TaxID=452637 RepID=B1ZXR0_OPITP|nr:hypothetical protein [Opitutus terrae]ACB74282.1 hypothetical protein Oter_0994 [Opitutus terrae PB90-1]
MKAPSRPPEPAIRFGSVDHLETSLKKALQKTWPRANYYDQSKPQMARRIAPYISKDSLDPALVSWMEQLVRVIRHEPILGNAVDTEGGNSP